MARLSSVGRREQRPARFRVAAGFGVAALATFLSAGACRSEAPSAAAAQPAVRRVLCSFAPMYVFTKNIVGELPGVVVEMMLLPAQGCPHDYELSVGEAKRIAAADVVVMNGGIESFAGEPVARINPRARQIIAWEGCERLALADDGHEELHDGHAHEHADADFNPHVWVSPAEAIRQVHNITEGLAEALPEHAEALRRNGAAYVGRLEALRDEFAKSARGFGKRKIVTTHDAFAYLARDLKLDVVATIRDAARVEPSPARLADVIARIREAGAAVVFDEPQFSGGIAQRVAEQAGVPLRTLDPVAGAAETPSADYYERKMRENLAVLRESLK